MALGVTDIVNAAYTALNGSVSATVVKWQTIPVQDTQLPLICLYALRATEESTSMSHPVWTQKTDTLVLDIHVKETTDAAWSGALDTLIDHTKRALLNDAAFVGLFERVSAMRQDISFDAQTDSRRVVVSLNIDLVHTCEYTPLSDTEVDLKIVHTEHDINDDDVYELRMDVEDLDA